jgi:hypothetical protein
LGLEQGELLSLCRAIESSMSSTFLSLPFSIASPTNIYSEGGGTTPLTATPPSSGLLSPEGPSTHDDRMVLVHRRMADLMEASNGVHLALWPDEAPPDVLAPLV